MTRRNETRLAYSTETGPAADRKQRKPRKWGETTPVPPAKGIRLRLERRASDRVVTLIGGLPGSPTQVAELARGLRAACGTGGTVKDGNVELQGDHRERVESWLAQRGLRSRRAGG